MLGSTKYHKIKIHNACICTCLVYASLILSGDKRLDMDEFKGAPFMFARE